MMRRHLIASTCCGVVITGTAIGRAGLDAHILAGLVTQPHSRTLSHWSLALTVLSALWMVRVIAQWTQARLSQRGATAAIADLSHRLLTDVTVRAPRDFTARRDEAAVVLTRGLDGMRPYY